MHKYVVTSKFGQGFKVKEYEKYTYEEDYLIVASYDKIEDAEAAVMRAQELEKQLRPLWQAAVENEIRIRNLMFEAVYNAAKPIN